MGILDIPLNDDAEEIVYEQPENVFVDGDKFKVEDIKSLPIEELAEVVKKMYLFLEKWTQPNYSNLSLNNNEERQIKLEDWKKDLEEIRGRL
jgi:hypothetical protein